MSANVEPGSCGAGAPCGAPSENDKSLRLDASLLKTLSGALKAQGVNVPIKDRRTFATQLAEAIRHRKAVKRILSRLSKQDDIIWMIKAARDAGNTNEAIWRSFVASHFGRTSARGEQQVNSAARFLCAFRKRPFWTWKRLSRNFDAFESWLFEYADKLGSLRFGNHRKYESPKPELILETVESFVDLADEYGSPSKLLKLNGDESDGFDVLYRRLRPIRRFGRTGVFDFLVLALDLKLISVKPQNCYLRGATGPLKGAKILWGDLKPKELDDKAAELACQLAVSPIVMEDCLCNWQKRFDSFTPSTCGLTR